MKLHVFAVYDSAVGAFDRPFFARSKGEAIRSFMDAASDPKTQFGSHASDFTLFMLGMYDDSGGSFECSAPERVMSALECLPKSD